MAKRVTTLEKLKAIEQAKTIYNIHYCNAGVGFCFYEQERDGKIGEYIGDVFVKSPPNWSKCLTTDKYYKTFEEAVDAEHKRLTQLEGE